MSNSDVNSDDNYQSLIVLCRTLLMGDACYMCEFCPVVEGKCENCIALKDATDAIEELTKKATPCESP